MNHIITYPRNLIDFEPECVYKMFFEGMYNDYRDLFKCWKNHRGNSRFENRFEFLYE